MQDPELFVAGAFVLSICAAAVVGAFREVRRKEREQRIAEREARRMAARRQAFAASQMPPAPRRPIRLPIGPGAEGCEVVRDLRLVLDRDGSAA